jgi:acyl-CoA thioesterase YciA
MELVTTYLCKTSDIGVHSNMFGGNLVALIDQSSAAYASQICDTPRMVTLSISEMFFKKPIKVGNIIKVYASVSVFGNTSVTLYIEIRKHNVYTGEQEVAMSTYIRFVRIDDEGNSLPISDRVKERYYKRVERFGKGLLDMEEKKLETDEETKSYDKV